MLEINNLDIAYKKVSVVRGVSFDVKNGEIVSILGSNGAGKSTILRCIAGSIHPLKGEILFMGETVQGLPAFKVARKGLCLIPEGSKIFSKLSVEDNLLMGTFAKKPGYMKEETSDKVYEMFPILHNRKKQIANTLSGGERQMLAIGRALMAQPKVLMLDEPTAGLSPILSQQVFKFINKIKNLGLTILLVEQQVENTLKVSDRSYVLENGEIVMSGKGEELLGSEKIRKAYLGL